MMAGDLHYPNMEEVNETTKDIEHKPRLVRSI
jgi:hypothetical protein